MPIGSPDILPDPRARRRRLGCRRPANPTRDERRWVRPGRALLVMQLGDEPAVRACLANDPWADGTLMIERVEPWALWLFATPST